MQIEIRNNQIVVDGYVSATGRDSRILPSPKGRFIEQIRPKTFQRALEKAEDIDLLFNHDKTKKLGSISQGNLELFEDNIGLRAIATISDEDVINRAKEGKLKGWSFGFYNNKDSWEDTKDGIQRRYLEDIDLIEVSILDKTPAYIATTIEQRGEDNILSETRGEDFKARIVDNSDLETRKNIDFGSYEREIEFLKMKGGK